MSAPLWTLPELIAATGAKINSPLPPHEEDSEGCEIAATAITGISIDTRTIQAGDLFVALKDIRDGHEFVPTAFTAGAAAALVASDYVRQPGDGDGMLLRVADPLRALEALGRAARARLSPDARVIAVTGSAGKTTTKEMLRTCLTPLGKTHASEKSYNNHWGVPLTLARMPADTGYAVFEIGMNHSGEITPLTKMVRPHVAVVTTVAPAHLGNFASVAEIAEAKAEIFLGLERGGMAVIPRDNAYYDLLRRRAEGQSGESIRVVSFGIDPGAGFRLIAATIESSHIGADAEFVDPLGDRHQIHVYLPGRHNLLNAIAVQAAVASAGVALPDEIYIGSGLPAEVMAGRGKVDRFAIQSNGNLGYVCLIDQSYNANPASMRAEIEVLGSWQETNMARRIAVLGDMLELGSDAPALHAELADAIETNGIDLVLAAGPLMRHLYDALPVAKRGKWAETSAGIEQALLETVQAGDMVMIKGSNGSRMAPLVAALLRHNGVKRDD